jgi:hypothetical protein
MSDWAEEFDVVVFGFGGVEHHAAGHASIVCDYRTGRLPPYDAESLDPQAELATSGFGRINASHRSVVAQPPKTISTADLADAAPRRRPTAQA